MKMRKDERYKFISKNKNLDILKYIKYLEGEISILGYIKEKVE